MKLKLIRDVFHKDWTQGKLFIDDTFLCYTLEDTDRFLEDGGTKVMSMTAIPAGTYVVVLDYSQKFKQVMPRLIDVPQFTGIRIHTGNKKEDTDGCPLVGMDRHEDGTITQSKVAYALLMKHLEKAGYIEIEVVNTNG